MKDEEAVEAEIQVKGLDPPRLPASRKAGVTGKLSRWSGALFRWVEVRTRWHELRGFGRSAIVRSTVIIPLVGYLILLNARLEPWLELHAPWMAGERWPFNGWRVLCLYFGSCALAFGSILFNTRCPPRIRDHSSPVSFVNADRSFFMTENHFNWFSAEIVETARRLRWWQKIPELAGSDVVFYVARNSGPKDREHALTDLMTMLWHAENTSRLLARFLVAIAFITGTCLVVAPSLMTFFQVSRASLLQYLPG